VIQAWAKEEVRRIRRWEKGGRIPPDSKCGEGRRG
jgi:hypothetical protein